ncbi:MAG: hypothetical protein IJX67_07210 [Oscillospiraceae bacterium]|nr:hypothetical protein [Clostridia bacterium]MBQ9168178.1 hypothetical protein [Oscillospiraceae bacterium]
MAEIKNNEVENRKTPESSTSKEITPKDQQKLAVQDNGENSNEGAKGKETDTHSKPQGEHQKLEESPLQGNANEEIKQPTANADNKHGKLAINDGNEHQSANASTSDGNVHKNSTRNDGVNPSDHNESKTDGANKTDGVKKDGVTPTPETDGQADGANKADGVKKDGMTPTSETDGQADGANKANGVKKDGVTPTPETDGQADGANKTDGVKKDGVTPTSETDGQSDGANKTDGVKKDGVTPTSETDGQADGANKADGVKKDGVTPTPETDGQADGVNKADGVKKDGVTPTSETDGQADGTNKTDGVKKDGITSNSGAEMKSDVPKKEGFFDRISNFFNRGKDSAENPTQPEAEKRGVWDGMETAPAPNGSGWTLLPGNHFDKYSDIDKNYADHPRTAYPKEQQEFRTVNPADIEGVYLGDSDVEDPSRFWGMHNGSKDAWMDTASHIPEVQARLDSGESLESLLQDDQLGKCAQAYFNPDSSKAIQVDEMAGGGYMFNGDGRHRIIAARANGYDIPVRVVGIRQ